MRRFLFTSLLLVVSFHVSAQKFQPYHAFGFEINANVTRLNQESSSQFGPDQLFDESSLGFDVLASYDYGFTSWLGLSSGLGLSLRGGAGSSYRVGFVPQTFSRDVFYLNLPLRLQFKPFKFLWIEPGMELNTYLWHSDNNPALFQNDLIPEEFKSFCLNWTAAMRFNLYRGLSLHFGMHRGLSPVYTGRHEYTDIGFRLGMRYLFNQPD
jgi:hypothetical protein